MLVFFFFSSRRRNTRFDCDWSSDVCSSDLHEARPEQLIVHRGGARHQRGGRSAARGGPHVEGGAHVPAPDPSGPLRSEERRVGKECRFRWSPDYLKKKKLSEHVVECRRRTT